MTPVPCPCRRRASSLELPPLWRGALRQGWRQRAARARRWTGSVGLWPIELAQRAAAGGHADVWGEQARAEAPLAAAGRAAERAGGGVRAGRHVRCVASGCGGSSGSAGRGRVAAGQAKASRWLECRQAGACQRLTLMVRTLHSQWCRTPCHLSASAGHKDALQLLLDRGANIEATDEVRAQRDAGPLPVSPAREQSETASTPAWRAAAGLVTARRAGGATDGIDRAVVDRAVVGRGLRRAGRSAGDAGETGRAGMPGASHRAVMGRRVARVGGASGAGQAKARVRWTDADGLRAPFAVGSLPVPRGRLGWPQGRVAASSRLWCQRRGH